MYSVIVITKIEPYIYLTSYMNTPEILRDSVEDVSKILEHMIQEVFSQLPKKRWNNQRIVSQLWQRSIKQIIADGETCYMNPCADYTLVFLSKIKNVLDQKIVIELWIERGVYELKDVEIPIAHLFIKLTDTQNTYIVDFASDNDVHIYPWKYKNQKPNIISVAINYIPSNNIIEDQDIFQIMESVGIYIPKEVFQAQIAKLQKDNTEEVFQDFIHRTENKITIFYNWNIQKINIGEPIQTIKDRANQQIQDVF